MPTAKIGDIDIYYEEQGAGRADLARAAVVVAERYMEGRRRAVFVEALPDDHFRLPRHGL